ncbi:MAG: hypothetical protein Q8M31_15905 [Beijerinckiaceae bacterium]|nr:hypothetical protein [Beijerinckiaceae bacterium]
MTIYAVNKLCYKALHDATFRALLGTDPHAALDSLPLSEDEKRLLLEGDVGELFRRGAHPFLLSHLSRFELFGLNVARYSQSMKDAAS